MKLPGAGVLPLLLLVLLVLPTSSWAQDFTYDLPDVTYDYSAATGSGSFTVDMTLDEFVPAGSDPVEVQGWSISVEHDGLLLTAVEAVAGPELTPAALGYEFGFELYTLFAGGWTAGVVIDLFNDHILQFPDPVTLVTVTYELVPGGPLLGATAPTDTVLRFGPDTGASPPVSNVVVVDTASFTVTEDNGLVTLVPHDGPPFIRGDTDRDGVLTIGDGIGVFSYLFLGQPSSCLDALDANDNGGISVTDGVLILCELFCVGTPPFPGPYPGCGFDPTDDGLDCQVNAGCP